MDSEGRLPPDDEFEDDFSLQWGGVDDPASEGTDDVLDLSGEDEAAKKAQPKPDLSSGVPWDELADDTKPTYEDASFVPTSALIPDAEAEGPGPHPDDEAPPHGDPLEQAADDVFEHDQPAARMDSLQDALSSIRERVQNLSSSMTGTATTATPQSRTSELSLYRQATDDRTLRELQRHSGETEDLLRRMSALMQDLSLDLRSIVDAARRAIDQTSEQAESSVELGRLLGDRIEQLDEQVAARLDVVDEGMSERIGQLDEGISERIGRLDEGMSERIGRLDEGVGERIGRLDEQVAARLNLVDEGLAERIDQMDAVMETFSANVGRAFDNMQVHLDKRLTKIEQRSGVGLLREELAELRTDLGEVRVDMGTLRDDVSAVAEGGGGTGELHERLEEVGGQLDRTLAALTAIVEGAPEGDEAVVDEVVSAIKSETEAAVEPFRTEVEDLGRHLSEALEREDQLGETLATLTDEVQRLRKRMSVRSGPTTIDDDQIQAIVDAVVAAVAGRRAPARAVREEPPEPEPPEPEPEPQPARRKRGRTARARPLSKADIVEKVEEVDEIDEIDDDELAGDAPEVEFGDIGVGIPDDDEEEPIRRARGRGRSKTEQPLVKGRRARSSR